MKAQCVAGPMLGQVKRYTNDRKICSLNTKVLMLLNTTHAQFWVRLTVTYGVTVKTSSQIKYYFASGTHLLHYKH